MSTETVELTVEEIIAETADAILVRYQDEEHWLPKSEIDYTGQIYDKDVEIEMPQWLAEEQGMV